MEKSNAKPHAREQGLMIRELPGEVLVYDLNGHKAHCLNQTAARIWKQCDGKSTVAEIACRLEKELKIPVDEEVVWVGVRRLGKASLLLKRVTPLAGIIRTSRRDLIKKVALVGGLSVASIVLPTAAEAASQFVSCNHVRKNGVFENGKCCTGHRGACHIEVDGCGTCSGSC